MLSEARYTIPLKVLICDASDMSSMLLMHALEKEGPVISIQCVSTIDDAKVIIRDSNINTIFIDPIKTNAQKINHDLIDNIVKSSEFIFSIRKTYPEIVFVLYMSRSEAEEHRSEFYRGERSRFSHYYYLDKGTPIAAFAEEVRAVVELCQRDLRFRMSETSIRNLLREASQSLTEQKDKINAEDLLNKIRDVDQRISQQNERDDVENMTVFLSYSFSEHELVEGMKRLLDDKGFKVVTGESANTYVSRWVIDKIRRSEYFLCIITKYEKKEDGNFTPSPWLLEEKGVALAFGKRLVLMVEDGVTNIGGLQGDWQRISFSHRNFLNAAYKAVDQLKSYSGGT